VALGFHALISATFVFAILSYAPPARAGEFQLGVERLFGISAYVEVNHTESDFGDFETTHSGIQAQLFGTTTARGDGQETQNTSAMPRLHVDYQWDSGWSLGGVTGWVITTGRRDVKNGESLQDPYIYPVRVLGVIGVRGGKEWRLSGPLSIQVLSGPQISLTSVSGDGARDGSFALQLAMSGALVVTPFQHVRVSIGPYADLGFYGRSHQTLQVSGVPESTVSGSLQRHGFGLACGLALSF
jgi:hypothetical protein